MIKECRNVAIARSGMPAAVGEVTRFAPVLGSPHGRLHFCGEHLATTSRGMEGAMASAEEAAAAILENV